MSMGCVLYGPAHAKSRRSPLAGGGRSSPRALDAYVARAMKTFAVPGMAVTVVADGRVLLARGYGVRRLGRPEIVDAQTLFGIASNTKVMTATALAMLVEAVSGQPWEDFVGQRILRRVGMTTSNVRHSDAARGGNVATP